MKRKTQNKKKSAKQGIWTGQAKGARTLKEVFYTLLQISTEGW
jgi:hypothetical protein